MSARVGGAGRPQGKLRALPPGIEPFGNNDAVTLASGRRQNGFVAGNVDLGLYPEFVRVPADERFDPGFAVERLALQAKRQRAQAAHFARQRKAKCGIHQNIARRKVVSDRADRHPGFRRNGAMRHAIDPLAADDTKRRLHQRAFARARLTFGFNGHVDKDR